MEEPSCLFTTLRLPIKCQTEWSVSSNCMPTSAPMNVQRERTDRTRVALDDEKRFSSQRKACSPHVTLRRGILPEKEDRCFFPR